MNYVIKECLRKIAISFAALWFLHRDKAEEWIILFVYPSDLGSGYDALKNKRIAIEIRLEDLEHIEGE